MKVIDTAVRKIDTFQQAHNSAGFLYGVIKKYSDDEAGYKGGLITYYAFLSLFPLLIVLTSILQLTLQHNDALRAKVISAVGSYLPLIGSELQHSVHSPHKTGIALGLGIILIFYGTRGVADALRYTFNYIWGVPRRQRPGGPKAIGQSLSIIIVGGSGLLLAGVLSSYATGLGRAIIFRVLSSLISILILFGVLVFVMKIGTAKSLKRQSLVVSALTAAIGLQILQTFGGYLITHELKHLSALYGTLALVLGLLFWIYLQTKVLLYTLEAGVVHSLHLWPRSLSGKQLLPADRAAYAYYLERDQYTSTEEPALRN